MFSHEPIEWPDEVEELVDRLEGESAERKLTREERAIMDVYETVVTLEGADGLHGFWQSDVNHQRVIKSFELIGATGMVDPINASRWCETRPDERGDYSETEEEYLSTIEEELFEGMDELVDQVLAFIEDELEYSRLTHIICERPRGSVLRFADQCEGAEELDHPRWNRVVGWPKEGGRRIDLK